VPPTIVPRTSNHTARIPLTGALTARTRRDAVANVPKLDPGCYLAVEDGDEVVVVPVESDVFRIGRSPSADLNLDDVTVSRRHALILLQDGVARVVDDRSLNGVEVNGERVREATLATRDEIALGRVRMRWVHVPGE
jgi:pSer/pThr/pTyr-binding forkhead associated (FHA) protein